MTHELLDGDEIDPQANKASGDKNIDVKCRDDVGRLYGIDLEEYPKVVRYRIAFD